MSRLLTTGVALSLSLIGTSSARAALFFLFRPTTEKPGEADLIIAKHRNGGLGDIPLTFQNEYPRFLGLQRAA